MGIDVGAWKNVLLVTAYPAIGMCLCTPVPRAFAQSATNTVEADS